MGAPTTLVPPQEAPSSAPTQKTADAADVMANAMVTATNESAEQQQQQQQQQQAMGGVVSGTVVQQPQQPQAQQRPNGSAAASVDMANWHAQWQAQAATAAALQAALYKTPHANANAFIPPALNPAAFAWVNNMQQAGVAAAANPNMNLLPFLQGGGAATSAQAGVNGASNSGSVVDGVAVGAKGAAATPSANVAAAALDLMNGGHAFSAQAAAAAAAVLQPQVKTEEVPALGGSGATHSLPSTLDGHDMDEREVKKQRRKQSNRESARRSRLRKQAECEELSVRVNKLTEENASLLCELSDMKSRCGTLADENKKLQQQLNAYVQAKAAVRANGKDAAAQLAAAPMSENKLQAIKEEAMA